MLFICLAYFQISPKTFGRVQVWALAELLKDIRRVVQKPLLSCLGFLLKFFGLSEDEPLLQSEDHSALEQVNINDDYVHCCIYLSLDLDNIPSSHNIMLPQPCFIVGIVLPSCAWFPPDITLSIQAKEFNPCFIRLENFVSRVMGVLQVSVGKLSVCRLSCAFSWGVASIWSLPNRPNCWSAAEIVVLLEGSPLFTENPRVTIRFLITSLSNSLLKRFIMLAISDRIGGNRM